MYKGQIVETGSMKQVFDTPAHPYTKALLACRPLHFPKGKRLPVVADFMQQPEENMLEPTVEADSTDLKMSRTPLIEVQQLKVWFPAKRALFGKPRFFNRAIDDISFTIYEGETLGIVGESGCGKTTLGRSLLKLVAPTTGRILYRNRDLSELKGAELRHFRKNIQLVFQDPYSSLNPKMTIGAAIEEPLLVHGILSGKPQRKNKAIELLEKVNLPAEYYHRYPHEFSGGQRQRIVIARALAVNPSFLVCDESVSALDVSVQAQVLNLLNDLKKEFGFTIVFISHDLSVVRYISDRIMVMDRGKIVESGPANDVFYRPQAEYTRKLIEAIPNSKHQTPNSVSPR
jgi:peptide/nickel transport system ATP-binding protein